MLTGGPLAGFLNTAEDEDEDDEAKMNQKGAETRTRMLEENLNGNGF